MNLKQDVFVVICIEDGRASLKIILASRFPLGLRGLFGLPVALLLVLKFRHGNILTLFFA